MSKCRELNAEIVSNSSKVAQALKLSQDDQVKIEFLLFQVAVHTTASLPIANREHRSECLQLKCILHFVADLSSYHETAINALYELASELPAICLPHQDGGILLSAFPNGPTSKLAGLLSTLVI